MYTLYASKNTYSMSAHLLLEELQVDYQIKWFDIRCTDDHPPEFKTINPNLTVPAIITTTGPITESAAILVYLAEQHGNQFIPQTHDPQRSQFLQWQFYLMSSLQPEVLNQFHPERYMHDDTAGQQKLLAASMLKIEKIWQLIETRLQSNKGYFSESYSVCDMLFAMQALWTQSQPECLQNYPGILNNLSTIYSRQAARQVLHEHDVEHLATLIHQQSEQIEHHKESV